jgi:peroxiredoxin
MLQVGDRIPLDAKVRKSPRDEVSLGQLVQDGPVLLSIHLFDWSDTCTNEVELLRDRKGEFDAIGVRPFGVSRDSPWTHLAWAQVHDLNFPLLSDWNGELTNGFGIARDFFGYAGVPERSAFLIDETGTVHARWIYDTDETPDVDALLDAARALSSSR